MVTSVITGIGTAIILSLATPFGVSDWQWWAVAGAGNMIIAAVRSEARR